MANQSVLRKYLRKYFWWIVVSVLFAIGSNYLNLQLPLMLQPLVDDVVFDNQWDLLNSLFIKLIVIFVGSGFLSLFRTLTVQYIGTNVVYEIRGDMFQALQKQSYSFYDQNRTGDIMSKATSDVNQTRNFLSQQFGNLMRDIVTLLIILVQVFVLNWKLSLVMLSFVPLLFIIMVWYRKKMYKNYMNMSIRNGSLTSTIQENITGVRVVKAFAREKEEGKKFDEENNSFFNTNMKVIRLSTNYGPLQELITQFWSVMLLVLGGVYVIGGNMTLGEVSVFFAFFPFLYDPIRNIVNIMLNFSQVQAAMVRINSILENKSEIVEAEKPIIPEKIEGNFKFEEVSFSYENDEHYALKNLNLNIKAGETIAILGATGSGKSTFINLIPRFYDPSKGKILLDGIDIKDYKIDEYRRLIGMVSQDIFLFSRSIKDNIAYGVKGKKQEEIEEVAKIASIHNFIVKLPDGYKTKVGERGQTLSGGQKQRIAIARALLTDPKILILDDSLSAVDIDTEAQIQKALDTLFTGRTTFIITQRISTIKNCDKICILDNGEITEYGDHETLYKIGGIYTKIYDTMFKAQTKSLERKAKSKIIVEAPLPYEDIFPEDTEILKQIYEEKYPDEEKRGKAEQKLREKLEKRIEKEKKKRDTKQDTKQDSEEILED